jgi:hypothetical protein
VTVPDSSTIQAVRLFDQAVDDPVFFDALVRAAEMLAVQTGHRVAGERYRRVMVPEVQAQRATLDTRPRRK